MVTIMECGQPIRLVWINSALVRLSELQEAIENQKASRTIGHEEPVCTASAEESTVGSAAD
jgi:hypothetical protein